MRQLESDRLLAWTMMNALQTGILVEQNQLGRPLNDLEFEDCYSRTRTAVETMMGFLAENRRK